jgi:hypothetical protein
MQPCKHIAPRFVKLANAFLDVTPRHVSCRGISVVWDVYVPILGNPRIVAGHVFLVDFFLLMDRMGRLDRMDTIRFRIA